MTPIERPTCSICGELLAQVNPWEESNTCNLCREDRPPYQTAVAYGACDGELRELIHLLKYDQVHPAAAVLGGMLAQAIAKLELIGPVLVIPVPLRASKRRQRGFNQAESIARVALKSMREKRFQLAAGVLQRVRPTVSQIGLTRPQRRQNMRGAFNVAHLNKVSGRGILLVDDVMTTGTTVAECARVLRRAGARNVWVATVARTLKNNGESSVVERTAVAVNE
jgi:ComF family protein